MTNEELGQFERLDMLEEAREHLQQAVDLIEQVFPDDEYVKAYMIDHLKIRVGCDHGFLSGDLNIDSLIDRIQDGEEE
jgi:hypothetical protein